MQKLGLIVSPTGIEQVIPFGQRPEECKESLQFWDSIATAIDQFDERIRSQSHGVDPKTRVRGEGVRAP